MGLVKRLRIDILEGNFELGMMKLILLICWDLQGMPQSAVPVDVEVEGLTCQVVLEKA